MTLYNLITKVRLKCLLHKINFETQKCAISEKNTRQVSIKHLKRRMSENDVFLCVGESELVAEPDGEPVENLSDGDKADSKAKSTEAAKARNEVQPGHLW